MKVFNSNEFINKLNWLVNEVPNYYYSKNGTWCNYNKEKKKFMMDCVVSIKGLLWGFTADKDKPHGGGKYKAHNVADFSCNGGLNYCEDVSKDFTGLVPGEYLCMKGTLHNHAGIYLGNGKVFECTTGWKANKCIISDIDSKGNRSYKGVKNLKWTYHGKLIYIEYLKEEEKEPSSKKIYIVKPGDTLSKIAKIYNTSWKTIYKDNKELIDNEAKKHGYKLKLYNHIFPGEKLVILN